MQRDVRPERRKRLHHDRGPNEIVRSSRLGVPVRRSGDDQAREEGLLNPEVELVRRGEEEELVPHPDCDGEDHGGEGQDARGLVEPSSVVADQGREWGREGEGGEVGEGPGGKEEDEGEEVRDEGGEEDGGGLGRGEGELEDREAGDAGGDEGEGGDEVDIERSGLANS